MSLNKSLMKVLSKDMDKNLLISTRTEIYKDKNKFNHIYSYSDTFKCQHNGFIEFEFNNESAWFWNKDIKVILEIDDKKINLTDLFTDYENIEMIGDNNFLFSKIKQICSFMIKLEQGETLKWSFEVMDNNSIDFKLFFRIDYLGVLENYIKKNTILNDEISIKKFYIEDLEKKAKNNEKVLEAQQEIIDDLNYKISGDEKIINLMKKKIRDLEKQNNDLEKQNNDLEKKNNNFKKNPKQNEILEKFMSIPVNPWNEFNSAFDYPYKRTRNNKYYGRK